MQVTAKQHLIMVLKEDSELMVTAHDKGEEHFVHYELWPSIPQIHQVKLDDFVVDVTFEKLTNRKDGMRKGWERCKPEPYSYFGMYVFHVSTKIVSKHVDV